ncbi:MAG: hypothetical protein ACK53Y_12505 [bacterium]
MSKNNSTKPTSLTNNVVHVRTGAIDLSNYIEHIGHTPCNDLDSSGQDKNSYIPLPHQDQPDETTDMESNSSTPVNAKQSPPASKMKTPLKRSFNPKRPAFTKFY